MNKKAFTLIELIAVIIILAIAVMIATPIITGLIEEAEMKTEMARIHLVVDAADLYYSESMFDPVMKEKVKDGVNIYDELQMTGDKPETGVAKLNSSGEVSVSIFINDRCYIKNFDSVEIYIDQSKKTEESCIPPEPYVDIVLADQPNIVEGLVPVTINDDGTIILADDYTEWYNYEEKIWANAVVLNANVEIYPGDYIPYSAIHQMYVWVPRYEYKFKENATSADAIDINFIGTEITNTNNTQGYTVHPAFSLRDDNGVKTELTGMWVAKYKVSTNNFEIKYDLSIKGYYVAANFYEDMVTNGKNYDLNHDAVDMHMIKNTEWGAIAYLSQSKFGICNSDGTCTSSDGTILKVENNSSFIIGIASISAAITGYGGTDENRFVDNLAWEEGSTSLHPDKYEWATAGSIKSSTNHNVSGIFDMAAGKGEYVAGISYDSGNENLGIPFFDTLDEKYVDKYFYGTSSSDMTRYLVGDATVETAGYNDDDMKMLSGTNYSFIRGGVTPTVISNGIFAYNSVYYNDYGKIMLPSSRPVLWTDPIN